MEKIKKVLFYLPSILLILTLSFGCTKKEDNNEVKGDKTADLITSFQESDKELNQALEKVGYKDKETVLKHLSDFNKAESEVEKFKACLPISEALPNYKIRGVLGSDRPEFTNDEAKGLNKANDYCQWAGKVLDKFELELSDQDLKEISEGVENSNITFTKRVFSNRTKCTADEYAKLLNINDELYTNPRVISAILILTSIQRDGNAGTYVPRYKAIVERKNPEHKELLFYFLEQIKSNTTNPATAQLKKGSIEKATVAFAEFGIKNIEDFMKTSLQTAPNCLSSIGSGVIDISRSVATQRTMISLHNRIVQEVKKTNSLPVEKSEGATSSRLSTKFKNSLDREKVKYLDSWYRPILIKGNVKNFTLISIGKDRKVATKDDLTYPKSEQ